MKYRRSAIITTGFLLLSLSAFQGCGSSPAPVAANVTASHGGNLLEIPGGKGFLEFGVEAIGPASDKVKNKPTQAFAYFTKVDGSGPMDLTSDVTFTPDGGSAMSLKADAKSPGRFTSDPGTPLKAGREVSGELSASVGGEVVKVTVVAR